MNSMVGGVTCFGQQIQSLLTKSKLELLAYLFSLLPSSEGFQGHHSDLHDAHGRMKGSESQTQELVKLGGTEEDLVNFIQNANLSAVEVGHSSSVKRSLEVSKNAPQPRKKNKSADVKFKEEVDDREGVERKYSDSFSCSLDLEISSLEVDPILRTRVNFFHVEGLKTEMLRRFDPTLLCIAVRPEDVSKYDPKNPQLSRYCVIQGVHSFRALQSFQKENKLHRLPGMAGGMVTVTVVNVEETDLILYGHLRSNALASTFVRRPQPQVRGLVLPYLVMKVSSRPTVFLFLFLP